MKFEDVVKDVEKLIGKNLNSIRPGANIQILKVDLNENKLELVDAKGKHRTRSLDELRRVWENLCIHPAVHVDAVLGGSGSSRNQPETIYANLPYIEVVYISNKKHITYVPEKTHPIGTIKEMDAIGGHKIRTSMESVRQVLPTIIILTNDARPVSASFETISGQQPTSTMQGAYIHKFYDKEILVVSVSSIAEQLTPGVYIPIDSKGKPEGGKPVQIAGEKYHLVVRNGINLLVRSVS